MLINLDLMCSQFDGACEQSTFLNFSAAAAAAVLEVLHSIIISLVSADIDLQVIVAPCGRALHCSVHMSYECKQIWVCVCVGIRLQGSKSRLYKRVR